MIGSRYIDFEPRNRHIGPDVSIFSLKIDTFDGYVEGIDLC